MRLFLLILITIPSLLSAQAYDTVWHANGKGWHLAAKDKYDEQRDADVIVKGDTIYYKSINRSFIIGSNIKLGNGTMPEGDFKYIGAARSNWLYQMSGDLDAGAKSHLGLKWNGHFFKIKGHIKYGSPKRGYTNYLRLGGGNIVDYECDIVNALKSGEVIVDGYTPPSNSPVIIQQAKLSVADELIKLKKLKDDGVLTEAEYEAQKKKLLE